MAVVNELITKFSYDGSTAPLQKFNAGLGGSIKLLGAVGVATVAAAVAINKFAQSTLASLDPLIQLSRTSRVAIENIQELGFAASVSGSSAAALEGTISSLGDKIGEAAQRGSEDFSRLGISVRDFNGQVKSADRILLEVGQRFQALNLSAEEQVNFAQRLGIDRSLIQLLRRSGREIDGLRSKARALGLISKEDAKATVAFNDALTTLRFGLSAVKNSLAVSLAPEMERMAESFTDFLADNKELIEKGLRFVVDGVSALASSFVRLAPVLAAMTVAFALLKIQAIGLSGVLAFIGSPVIIVAAAIAVLLLIVDDLIVAFQGGQSVIADFFQEFLGVDIRPHLQSIVEWVKSFIQYIGQLFDTGFEGFWDDIVEGLKALADIFTNLFQKAFDGIASYGMDALGSVKEFFGFGDDDVEISEASIRPGTVPAVTTNNNAINQAVQIDIRTDDPRTAGQSVRDGLQEQLFDAQTQFAVGGL